MKLPILLFFASQFYYAAKMVVGNKKEVPSNIFLSGSAAKSVEILGKSGVEKLARGLFSKVCDSECKNMRLVLVDFPKEITCKGALKADLSQRLTGCKIQFWIGYDNDDYDGIYDKSDKSGTPKYSEMLLSKPINDVISSINNFYNVLDDYISSISLQNEYDIEDVAYDKFKNMRNEYLKDYMETGLKSTNRTDNNYVEDTMFFYPFGAMLNRLSDILADSYNTLQSDQEVI